MENAGPVLILIGNCCIFPAVMFGLGVAWSRGWIRSPIAVNRDDLKNHNGLYDD